jgi:hypothetical protein
MGGGSSSNLQAQTSAVAVIGIEYSYSSSTSEQVITCEHKEAVMRGKCIETEETGVKRIGINIKCKLILMAALLMFGYGDCGFSPSALAYSIYLWNSQSPRNAL